MNGIVMDLQFFAEEGAAAAAAPEAAGSTQTEAAVNTEGTEAIGVGDTLPNGQQVKSAQVAAELERQMKRHPELRKVYGQKPQAQAKGQAAEAPHEMTIQEKWEAAKKGEFKDLYGQDVQAAIRDRFKNQEDARAELDTVNDVMEILRGKAGVETNDELLELLRNDDSLYEEEAEAAGMTVERYKEFKALQEEHNQRAAEDQQALENEFWDNHFSKMTAEAEQLKQMFPDFDLRTELANEKFARLTHPSVGISVEDAYRLVHKDEIDQQMMAYAMNRQREQMAQTIQAQRARPVEGAMSASAAAPAAGVAKDFGKMTRQQRDEYRRKVLSGLIRGGDFA